MHIRRYKLGDSIKEITNLLTRAHQKYYLQGMKFLASRNSKIITFYRMIKGEGYVIIQDSKIIATLTLMMRRNVCIIDQIAVDVNFQNRGIGSFLLTFAENRAKQLKIKYLQLDTADDATELVSFYVKRGFNAVDSINKCYTNYTSTIFRKELF
jgi:N-acetylglutamate synthase-like GNAT family acetyltransferase